MPWIKKDDLETLLDERAEARSELNGEQFRSEALRDRAERAESKLEQRREEDEIGAREELEQGEDDARLLAWYDFARSQGMSEQGALGWATLIVLGREPRQAPAAFDPQGFLQSMNLGGQNTAMGGASPGAWWWRGLLP